VIVGGYQKLAVWLWY